MTYLVATVEVIYDELDIVKRMLETGEYGINGYPITEQSMVEFIKNIEFGIDHVENFDRWGAPLYASIKNEDGTELWYYSHIGLKTLDNPAQN